MGYRSSDLYNDTECNRVNPKRLIFYQRGLKIYGLLPYILCRRLKAQFISNYWVSDDWAFRGAGVIAPTNEANYSALPYSQSPENAQRLWDWLHADKGFEYAIAGPNDFGCDTWRANVGQFPPEVWVPGSDASSGRFVQVLAGNAGINLGAFLSLSEY